MKTVQSFLLVFLLIAVNGYPQNAFPSGSEAETITSERAQSSPRPESLTTLNESTMEQLATQDAEEEVVPIPISEPILDQKSEVTSRNDSGCTTEIEQGTDPVSECKTEASKMLKTDQASEAAPRSEGTSLTEPDPQSKISENDNVPKTSETNDAATTDQAPDATSGSNITSAFDQTPESPISEDSDSATMSEISQASEAALGSDTATSSDSTPGSQISEDNNAAKIWEIDQVSEVSKATTTSERDQAPEAAPGSDTGALFNSVPESETSEVNNATTSNRDPDANLGSDSIISPDVAPPEAHKPATESERDQATEAASKTETTGLYDPAPEADISEDNHQHLDTNILSETAKSLDPNPEIQANDEALAPETSEPGSETNDIPTTTEVDQIHVLTPNLETTASPDLVPESGTSDQNPVQTSSPPNVETPSNNLCTEAGNFSDPNNCLAYITCTGNGTDLSLQENECPEWTAFSPVVERCTRDISPCGDIEPLCLNSGSLADPTTTSAYYWCVPSLLGGFHKFHVQCASSEVYTDLIGLCWYQGPYFGPMNYEPNDRDIAKADWKLLKKAIKVKAKEEKVRQKMEAKAKAHADKLAAKQRKKQKGTSNVDNDVTVD